MKDVLNFRDNKLSRWSAVVNERKLLDFHFDVLNHILNAVWRILLSLLFSNLSLNSIDFCSRLLFEFKIFNFQNFDPFQTIFYNFVAIWASPLIISSLCIYSQNVFEIFNMFTLSINAWIFHWSDSLHRFILFLRFINYLILTTSIHHFIETLLA